MNFKEIVGIDVSKKTLDIFTHQKKCSAQYENTVGDIKKMVKWVFSTTKLSNENVLFVFEHTGLYSDLLMTVLSDLNIKYSVVSGLEIKRSMGIVRGKSDEKDAAMIALYGYRLREELKLTEITSAELQSLKRLITLRDQLVKQRTALKTNYGEQKKVLKVKENKILFKVQEQTIDLLTKQIDKVEREIKTIIESHEKLNNLYTLITSIKGVGTVTAWYMIVYTQGFMKFDNWRQFASYCGIAPFPKSSGTSIMGKTKVSHLANKKIKSLLDMCAKVSIQYNPEMKLYYQRRIKEGKSKMSTINVIRNKLLSRIFAVVKRETPYVDVLKYAA